MAHRITWNLASFKPHSLFIGVDLGGSHHAAIVLDERRQLVARFSFLATHSGFEQLAKRRLELIRKYGAGDAIVGMEPSGGHWMLLAADLEQRDVPYVLVNPYTVRVFRQAVNLDRSKDDFRDAYSIADLVRIGKFTRTRLQHGDYAELRVLTHHFGQLRNEIARVKNQLRSTLMCVFPELNHLLPNLDTFVARSILCSCAVASSIRQMTIEEFSDRVRAAYQGHLFPVTRVSCIYLAAQSSIGLQDSTTTTQMMLNHEMQLIDLLTVQQQEVQKQLETVFLRTPEARPMLSLPWLGACTAARILGEIGDPRHYDTGKQLVKLAGLQPTPNTSGNKTQSESPISRQGRAGLRTALYFVILRLLRHDAAFRRRYLYLQQRPVNHLTKMQAIAALMAKLLRVLWALIYHQATYIPGDSSMLMPALAS
jgi:transposase